MGGGNGSHHRVGARAAGLSPRGRGKRPHHRDNASAVRSIPAWAGETTPQGMHAGIAAVYPRVGGGNGGSGNNFGYEYGLSPRGRGKPPPVSACNSATRSIPAWAGETYPIARRRIPPRVYPRVGGGNAKFKLLSGAARGLSPRGRGKRVVVFAQMQSWGSIPAWAGETAYYWCLCRAALGLSPRGRGKPLHRVESGLIKRSIPAWAGETHQRYLSAFY